MGEGGTLAGATAFKLYDTYGFPLDLTQDVMRGFNWKVDTDGFNAAMEEQKAKARKAWAGSGDSAMAPIYVSLADRLGSTEFLGYETTEAEALITAMIADEAEVEAAKPGQAVSIICNQTPFYAESGGQIGDTDDLLIGQARDLFPPRCGFIIIVIDGDEQFVFRQTIHIGDQCPGVIDRLFLEIIAKRKIPQHFEERVVTGCVTDIFKIIMLAACTDTFL